MLKKKLSQSRRTVSLDVANARNVRDFAFKERTRDNPLVELSLRDFFESGHVATFC
jgi:hypothetical protein